MKKLVLFVCSALIIGFISCSSDEPLVDDGGENPNTSKEAYIQCKVSDISFNSNQSSELVLFETNRDWSISFENNSNSDKWIDVDSKTGKAGSITINIKVSTNTGTERQAYLKITAGDKLKNITIIQKGNNILNVSTPGNLPNLISDKDKTKLKSLTLTGYLNGKDINFIRNMLGRDFISVKVYGNLSELDLTDTEIIEGGGSYLANHKHSPMLGTTLGVSDRTTSNNTIGRYMFLDCDNLEEILFFLKV